MCFPTNVPESAAANHARIHAIPDLAYGVVAPNELKSANVRSDAARYFRLIFKRHSRSNIAMKKNLFTILFAATAVFALTFSGCDNSPTAISYFSLQELQKQEKFQGYDVFTGPEIDGPYRIVSGVNFTIRREGMELLWRELDFADKRWVFKDPEAMGHGYRFLALSNDKGEQCAILLKSKSKVDLPKSGLPPSAFSDDHNEVEAREALGASEKAEK